MYPACNHRFPGPLAPSANHNACHIILIGTSFCGFAPLPNLHYHERFQEHRWWLMSRCSQTQAQVWELEWLSTIGGRCGLSDQDGKVKDVTSPGQRQLVWSSLLEQSLETLPKECTSRSTKTTRVLLKAGGLDKVETAKLMRYLSKSTLLSTFMNAWFTPNTSPAR